MDNSKQTRLFLSYSSADYADATQIAQLLEQRGYSVLYQARDFATGGEFIRDIHRALDETDLTVALMTPNYMDSDWTEREWTSALKLGKLFPVQLRRCNLKGLLAGVKYLDLVGIDGGQVGDFIAQQLDAHVNNADLRQDPSIDSTPRVYEFQLPPPNLYYTGRTEETKHFAKLLDKHSRVAVWGLPGVGKSEFVAEYVRSRQNLSRFWFHGENLDSVLDQIEQLARQIGLPVSENLDPSGVFAVFRQWLSALDDWLLVFDGAVHIDSFSPLIPSSAQGRVIFSTLAMPTGSNVAPFELSSFEEEEAIQFFLHRSSLLFAQQSDTQSEEIEAIEAFVNIAGGLPLVLDHVAVFVSVTGMSVGEYLNLYQQRGEELRNVEGGGSLRALTISCSLALDRLSAENEAAVHVLEVLSFFGPHPIPMFLITGEASRELGAEFEQCMSDPLRHAEVLGAVCRYAFLKRDADQVSMHTLIRDVLRDRVPLENHESYISKVVQCISTGLPLHIEYSNMEEFAALTPHVLSVSLAPSSAKFGIFIGNCNRIARWLAIMGSYRSAEILASGTFEIIEHLGVDYQLEPDVLAVSMIIRAEICLYCNDVDMARDLLERLETENLNKHTMLGLYYLTLGDLYKKEHEWNLAAEMYALAASTPDIADFIDILALSIVHLSVLNRANRLQEANELVELIEDKTHNAPESIRYTFIYEKAKLLIQSNCIEEAKILLEKSLENQSSVHPMSQRDILWQLAEIEWLEGNHESAKVHQSAALDAVIDLYGPQSPIVADFLISQAHESEGPGSDWALERGLELLKSVVQMDDYPNAIGIEAAAAECLYRSKRFLEARDFLESAISRLKVKEATNIPLYGRLCNDLGSALCKLKEFSAGEKWLEEAISVRTETLGRNSYAVVHSLSNLGRAQLVAGSLTNALDTLGEAWKIIQTSTQEYGVNLFSVPADLASVQIQLGNSNAAIEIIKTIKKMKFSDESLCFEAVHSIADLSETCTKYKIEDMALELSEIAIQFAERLGPTSISPITTESLYYRICRHYLKSNQWTCVKEYADRGIHLIKGKAPIANLLILKAMALDKAGQHEEAETFSNEGWEEIRITSQRDPALASYHYLELMLQRRALGADRALPIAQEGLALIHANPSIDMSYTEGNFLLGQGVCASILGDTNTVHVTQKLIQKYLSRATFTSPRERVIFEYFLLHGALPEPEHTQVRKIEYKRNQKCPCGSGKKFKHCHLDRENEL